LGNPLNKLDLQLLCDKYNIQVYVETGTGEGNSLISALKLNRINKFYTIDLDTDILKSTSNKIGNLHNIIYINDNSINALNTILLELKNVSNILFFLDAHFPFADFKKISYEESITKYHNYATPLKNELELIYEFRHNNNDLIILDDLRIYKDDNFSDGNWENRIKYNIGNEQFIYNIFSDRIITEYYTEQGFILIEPKI